MVAEAFLGFGQGLGRRGPKILVDLALIEQGLKGCKQSESLRYVEVLVIEWVNIRADDVRAQGQHEWMNQTVEDHSLVCPPFAAAVGPVQAIGVDCALAIVCALALHHCFVAADADSEDFVIIVWNGRTWLWLVVSRDQLHDCTHVCSSLGYSLNVAQNRQFVKPTNP